jgi:hypothetical protein
VSAVLVLPTHEFTHINAALAELNRCVQLVKDAMTTEDETIQLHAMLMLDQAVNRVRELKARQ